MSSAKVSENEVARRYAKTIFDLVQNEKDIEGFFDKFQSFVNLFNNNIEVKQFFCSPLISIIAKKNTVSKFAQKLKANNLLIKFLEMVINNNRINIISKIFESFKDVYYLHIGKQVVEVTAPKDMNKKDVDNLKKLLEKNLKCKIELQTSVNPKILGGLQIKIGSKLYDGSLAAKLNKFAAQSKNELAAL